MAFFRRTNRNADQTGELPDGDLPSLSYYLCCIKNLMVRYDMPGDLLNWKRVHSLSSSKQDALIRIAYHLSPDDLVNKLLIVDDKHELLPIENSNGFLGLDEVARVVTIAPDAVVAGQKIKVAKVMPCTTEWLKKYWLVPMKNLKNEIAKQANQPVEQILAYLDSVERHLLQLRLPGQTVKREVTAVVTSKPESERCDHPKVRCDACFTVGIRGDRYKCRECNEFDLCSGCYLSERGGHLRCSFFRMPKEGQQAIVVAPRVPLSQELQVNRSSESNNSQNSNNNKFRQTAPCSVASTSVSSLSNSNNNNNVSPTVPCKSVSLGSGVVEYPPPVAAGTAMSGKRFTEGQTVRIRGLPMLSCNGSLGLVEREIPVAVTASGGGMTNTNQRKYEVRLPSELGRTAVFSEENLEEVADDDDDDDNNDDDDDDDDNHVVEVVYRAGVPVPATRADVAAAPMFVFDPQYPLDAVVELQGFVGPQSNDNGKYGTIEGQQPNGMISVRLMDDDSLVNVEKQNVSVLAEES